MSMFTIGTNVKGAILAGPEGRMHWSRNRVYRVMKAHKMLLTRHAGRVERRHDRKIAVERSILRWCSDGFELAGNDGSGCIAHLDIVHLASLSRIAKKTR